MKTAAELIKQSRAMQQIVVVSRLDIHFDETVVLQNKSIGEIEYSTDSSIEWFGDDWRVRVTYKDWLKERGRL